MDAWWLREVGALPQGGGYTTFRVWAPERQSVEVVLESSPPRMVALTPSDMGYHEARVADAPPGTRYRLRLNQREVYPDPASRFQPEGVHGPSQVVSLAYPWTDAAWRGRPLSDYVTYEVHVGAFSLEGTFEGIVPHLPRLRDLGVTAIELMPVAQFPGARNWGYDGAYPYAVQHSYGGPQDLQRLVDACHGHGLAVVLDVVYNHLGPEGNYLAAFGPYFTERYHTPWGAALNFDGPDSDGVRNFFIQNALMWLRDYHVDALRLDAVHAIVDASAKPFLQDLAEAVDGLSDTLGRPLYLIAESDLNDARLLRSRDAGGFGIHAQWNDGFHHAIHTLLTGERHGYYRDYGEARHLLKALTEGFVYSGEYSPHRRRRHGNSSRDIEAGRLVVCVQNHDQVGNRMLGERLATLVDFESLKLAAGVLLLSPMLPLLFMGEEYGETAPFLYFVDHGDPALEEAVRKGRRAEFASFRWSGEPPDPQAEATFARSRLDHGLRDAEPHRTLEAYYRRLLALRREHPALRNLSKQTLEAGALPSQPVVWLRRWHGGQQVWAAFNFAPQIVRVDVRLPAGRWVKWLASAAAEWRGPGDPLPAGITGGEAASIALPPRSLALYSLQGEVHA